MKGKISLEQLRDNAEMDETLWAVFENKWALNWGEDGSRENRKPNYLGYHYYATKSDKKWI